MFLNFFYITSFVTVNVFWIFLGEFLSILSCWA